MFSKIIKFSLENKLLVILGVFALIGVGIYSATEIPLDAVPDITNNQVQIVSTAPTLAPQEVEQLITYPIEAVMTNIPDVTEVRSISRYGLSVVTVVFEDHVAVMKARQFVQEQLSIAKGSIPEGVTEPELMPITTGLGEIYQYVLTVEPELAHQYDATKIRTIQDWIVKRQLNGTKGIIEVSSFGGYLKQYVLALNPERLKTYELSIPEVITAVQQNNQNSGASYIEKGPYSFYIRSNGRLDSIPEIENVWVKNHQGVPIYVKDIATVEIGSAKRYGAMTMDGKGEVVGGITLMLKGANTSEVLSKVEDRIEKIQESLPEGVKIYPYLDRADLIGKTIKTVESNLLEGGLIVIFVLLILLGNLRAGLIVASVIPLSLLFALTMMRVFGISANLMSLGAIDFGIVIDGAVIIVEGILHALGIAYVGKTLSAKEMDQAVHRSAADIYKAAAFGVLIILVVFIPILTLQGIEGKTFRPMAQTVGFAIIGSMILSITYVPVMAALFLKRKISDKKTWSDRLMNALKMIYQPVLGFSLKQPIVTISISILAFGFSIFIFSQMGAEFVPTLEEGDLAVQQAIKPGSSLKESIETASMAEAILLENFPEVKHVVSKIGTAEVPTDPMAIEDADIMVIMKDKEHWTSAKTRGELMEKMKAKLEQITWAEYQFTQPIQLRFNELMTGSKADIAIKIFGEDIELLKSKADQAAEIIQTISGIGDVKVDQTDGLQQLEIDYDRQQLARYGVNVDDANLVVRTAYAGERVGYIFEEERKFDLVLRLSPDFRNELDLQQLTLRSTTGDLVPLSLFSEVKQKEGPMLISREQARRFINVGVNVRDADVATLVGEIQEALKKDLDLPAGYEIQYGGQFENLQNASARLLLAVPIALLLILLLLYMAFQSIKDSLIIFMAVPFSAIGGILALWLRGMPFSISSGIGFIALFGVAVLNGIVLVNAVKEMQKSGMQTSMMDLLKKACLSRLRPVLMTAIVAALGFLPMAISSGSGAEVQRPLATVVIGGLITSTLLTLLILPAIYALMSRLSWRKVPKVLMVLLFLGFGISAQAQTLNTLEETISYAYQEHPVLKKQALARKAQGLEQKAIGIWDPLDISYQGGQINYDRFDHFLTISQDISPLFRKKANRKEKEVLSYEQEAMLHQEAVLKKDLAFDIWQAYNQWNYYTTEKAWYDSLISLYEKIAPKIKAEYELGETEAMEWLFFQKEFNDLKRQLKAIQYKEENAALELRKRAYLKDAVIITPSTLDENLSDQNWERLELDPVLMQYYEDQKKILSTKAELEHLKSKQLNWNLGYFAQSLEHTFLFQGLSIGIQVPLDRRAFKVRKEQLQLEQEQIQMERELQFNHYQKKWEQLKRELQYVEAALQEFQLETRAQLSQLGKAARLKYELGEINFIEFAKIQERLLASQSSYLQQLQVYQNLQMQFAYFSTVKN
jgi:cobalt-zinc-cadmium resistance protein CzcA